MNKEKELLSCLNDAKEILNNNGYHVTDENVNEYYNYYINSGKNIELIKKEIRSIIEEKTKKQSNENEQHYDLNELFDCRISNNTLHIHVVPKSIKEDIKNTGSVSKYFTYVEERLDDALDKVAYILETDKDINIDNVFAVSPLLKMNNARIIFDERGFDTKISDNEYFQEMFNGQKIGEAVISKDKFLLRYGHANDINKSM